MLATLMRCGRRVDRGPSHQLRAAVPTLPFLMILTLMSVLLSSGCASSGKRGPRASSLSDAVRKVGKEEERPGRPLVVRDDHEDGEDDGLVDFAYVAIFDHDDDLNDSGCEVRPRRGRKPRDPEVRLVFGGGLLGGGSERGLDDATFSGGSLHLGAEVDRRWRGDVELTYRSLEPLEGRTFGALPDQEEWHIGANLRRYFAPPSLAIRPYGLIGFTVGELHWDYREPVEVISVDDWGYVTGHTWLSHDRMTTGSVFIGGGASFLRTPSVEVGVNGRVGYQFYDDETRAGLINDLFDPNGFGYLGLEVSFLP